MPYSPLASLTLHQLQVFLVTARSGSMRDEYGTTIDASTRLGWLFGMTGAMLAALCAAALPAAAQSDVSGRTRVDARMPPWNSIGKLQAVAGSLRITCTAARIGPRTVLSAAHCLFNVRTGRYVAPGSLHFVAGLEGGSFAAAALAQSIEPATDYDPAESNLTRGSDWAVIELAGPVAAAGPPLPLAPSPPDAGTDVLVGGYAQARMLGKGTMTEQVRAFATRLPRFFPLPHPSWRTTAWERRNPWFTDQALPALRAAVAAALA